MIVCSSVDRSAEPRDATVSPLLPNRPKTKAVVAIVAVGVAVAITSLVLLLLVLLGYVLLLLLLLLFLSGVIGWQVAYLATSAHAESVVVR